MRPILAAGFLILGGMKFAVNAAMESKVFLLEHCGKGTEMRLPSA